MADVQPDKFTKIANELLVNMVAFKFNGTQFKIILTVIRYTYGFNRKEHYISNSFLAKATGSTLRAIKKEMKVLLEERVIIVTKETDNRNSRKLMLNKDYEQWKTNRTGERLDTGEQSDTGEQEDTPRGEQLDTPSGERLDTQEFKKDIVKENIYTIFEHWKSKGIVVHKKLNKKMESHINARLQDYEVDDLIAAIDNYSEVFKKDTYYWTHRWTLQDFMKPNNLDRFLNESEPLVTYLANSKRGKSKTIDWEGFNVDD
jgi:phage replication O-like protein O